MSDPGSMSESTVEKKEECEMDDSSVVSEDPCPVCLSSRNNESGIDGCAHTFCYSCITEWLKVSESCPLCKAPVTEVSTRINGKAIIKKMSDLKAKAEADRIMAQANEVPMTSEREALTQLIHQQRAEVQQLIACKSMNRKNKKLNEKYKEETSKLTQYVSLREEMDRLPRRDILGDMRFREIVYLMQLSWREISRPATATRFNPSMACSDPDGLMQRLRPFLMRELKVVMEDKRWLNDQMLSKVFTAIQNYNINNPEFEMVLLNGGMLNRGYIVLFSHLLYEFCASGLELEAFDANSTYSINQDRAPTGRLIPSLIPASSRTSGPIVLGDEEEDDDDEPEIVDQQFRGMSDSSSSDGVHEIYNHRACHIRPSTNRNSLPDTRDTRTLAERINQFLPNTLYSDTRGLPRIGSILPSRNAHTAPEVISIDDESSSRGGEARINSIHRREREAIPEPSWLNVTGQDRPSTSSGFFPFGFGSRLNPIFPVPDIGIGLPSRRSDPETSSSRRDRDRDNRNNSKEITTSWRWDNGKRVDTRKDKREKEEKERRKGHMYMEVRNGSRKNNFQHYFDKLHHEEMSTSDLKKLSEELSSFSKRINSLKKMCDDKLSDKRKSNGATSSNESSQLAGLAVVDVDDDIIDMQEEEEDRPGPSNRPLDDSVVIL